MNRPAESSSALIVDAQNILGEGPLWHPERQELFWVDIEGKRLQTWNPKTGTITRTALPHRVTLVVRAPDEQLILGMQGGLSGYDPQTTAMTWWLNLEHDQPSQRCNDGGVDDAGRLWVGTMDMQCKAGCGRLYVIDKDQHITCKREGLTIPNGLCWNASQDRMYHIDSPTGAVHAFRFDSARAHLEPEGPVVQIPSELGVPDGMTIDAEGMLWIAHYGGHGVYRWNPENGELLAKIFVPAPHVTACAFGGTDLRTLYITTARQGMAVEALEEYPQSGGLFAIPLPVGGAPPAPLCRIHPSELS